MWPFGDLYWMLQVTSEESLVWLIGTISILVSILNSAYGSVAFFLTSESFTLCVLTMNCCYPSVVKSCLTLCDPMDCSTSGFPVLHFLSDFAQTLVHWVCDTIQPSQPLSAPSPTFYLSGTIHIHTLCGGTPWSKHWTELYLQCSQHLVLLKAIKCHRVETSLIFP